MRKLELIHTAKDVEDLQIHPGNLFESMDGDRSEKNNIRLNAQCRVCCGWSEGGAYYVELVDSY